MADESVDDGGKIRGERLENGDEVGEQFRRSIGNKLEQPQQDVCL